MKILAILQNQWFREPERIKALYERHPDMRNDLIARFLFMGCQTGKNLRRAFGEMCDSIVWEESSPEVGGFASSSFEADGEHIRKAIELHRPDIIVAFGGIAQEAVDEILPSVPVVKSPHPTARFPDNMQRLRRAAGELQALMSASV